MSSSDDTLPPGRKLKKEKNPYDSSGRPTLRPMVPNDVVARLNPPSLSTTSEHVERGSAGTTSDATGPFGPVLGPFVAISTASSMASARTWRLPRRTDDDDDDDDGPRTKRHLARSGADAEDAEDESDDAVAARAARVRGAAADATGTRTAAAEDEASANIVVVRGACVECARRRERRSDGALRGRSGRQLARVWRIVQIRRRL
jgi:hypothetical protein